MLLCAAATAAAAQQPADSAARQRATRDSLARCDSIVSASAVDSIGAALFISVRRSDGGPLDHARAHALSMTIGAAFVPPHPFRLAVFDGPTLMRVLRPTAPDTSELRAPTVTGVYRVVADSVGAISRTSVVRTGLTTGFDSASIRAIHDVAPVKDLFIPPDHGDSMWLDVRVSTDSIGGAVRLVSMQFPRMPIIDAVPLRDSPPPVFPEDEKADSVTSGDVVFRFIIDPSGVPVIGTVESVRASSLSFVRSALIALYKDRFQPATIRGCAVAQVVEYTFSFVLPESFGALRH